MRKNDYGGAFDIDPYSFWTRDDLDELESDIEDNPSIKKLLDFSIKESYIEDNVIELGVSYNESYFTVTEKIDMRKIKAPQDLIKVYSPILVKNILAQCSGTA